MANFTQLHLNHDSSKEPARKTPGAPNQSLSKEKVLFGSGLLAVTVMSGVFMLITNGCSKNSTKTGIEPPTPINPPSVVTTPAVALTVPPPAVTPKPVKKVQRKAPTATYADPNYGVSLRYPKGYILKKGDEPQPGLGPVQTNFVQPGAVKVATLQLPRSSYPGTDFTSGFFAVSINSSLSQQQCEQFAFPKNEPPQNEQSMISKDATPKDADAKPAISKVKIAGLDYTMVEDIGDSQKREPHLKYFHHFENGNCYEFSMGLGTVDDNLAGLKPVNRSLVFGKLEQILASVKLQPIATPEVARDAATHAADATPAHPLVEGSKE